MLKNFCVRLFLKNILKIGKLCRYKSRAEDYEILQHLVDKKVDMTKVLIPEAKYGGEALISLIIGTKPGHHAAEYINELFYKLRAPILFEEINVDKEDHDRRDVILSVLRNKCALNFDVHHTEIKKTEQSQMNDDLDLFAGVTKIFSVCGYNAKVDNVDIVMVNQNSSGDNTKLEYEPVFGLIETLKVTQAEEIMKLVTYAFAYAIKNRRRKITLIHKKISLPVSDNIMIECANHVRKHYPNIKVEEMQVDTAACELILNPQSFDIICCNDRYGNMLTSIACGVCGGPALFACCNIGDDHAVFQPLQNKLSIPLETEDFSPYGLITCAVQLLLHIDYCRCAEVIWKALLKTMLIDNYKTKYYGGKYTPKDVIERVIYNLETRICRK